jgi:hypothetical protein
VLLSEGVTLQLVEKLNMLSFRGTLRAEESLLLLAFKPGEIPHFARNENQMHFFRDLFNRAVRQHKFRGQ